MTVTMAVEFEVVVYLVLGFVAPDTYVVRGDIFF